MLRVKVRKDEKRGEENHYLNIGLLELKSIVCQIYIESKDSEVWFGWSRRCGPWSVAGEKSRETDSAEHLTTFEGNLPSLSSSQTGGKFSQHNFYFFIFID